MFFLLCSTAAGRNQADEERFAIEEPAPAPLDAALSEMDSTSFALLTSAHHDGEAKITSLTTMDWEAR